MEPDPRRTQVNIFLKSQCSFFFYPGKRFAAALQQASSSQLAAALQQAPSSGACCNASSGACSSVAASSKLRSLMQRVVELHAGRGYFLNTVLGSNLLTLASNDNVSFLSLLIAILFLGT
jgi:hypothetical protein